MKYIIVDMDNTIAKSGERSIFFTTYPRNYPAAQAGILHDEIIEPVRRLVQLLASDGYKVIIMSARAVGAIENSKKWMAAHDIPFDDVVMKEETDFRKDYIVKQEMIRTLIEKYGKPFLALEDRPDVIKMFLEEGVFSLTVNNVSNIAKEDINKEE